MHKLATALVLAISNLVRKRSSIGTTPAVAKGIEEKPWTLEQVVALSERFHQGKEDAKFEAAFAELEKS